MGVVEHKSAIFENIVRLRRVERVLGRNRDLANVRGQLEEQLGATVSVRLGAHLLGVSHTALAHWVKLGDLSTVPTAVGRSEIALTDLLMLFESVAHQRAVGHRHSHVLEPIMAAARERANEIELEPIMQLIKGADDSHRRAELRSLAYHRVLAGHLDQPMVDEALRVTWKWRDAGKLDPRYADRWEALLSRPVSEIRDAISVDDTDAGDLRQNSPFAGMLSAAERTKINMVFRS